MNTKLEEEGIIIVTNLYSNAMPLISYENSDIGILEEVYSSGFRGKVLKFSGR